MLKCFVHSVVYIPLSQAHVKHSIKLPVYRSPNLRDCSIDEVLRWCILVVEGWGLFVCERAPSVTKDSGDLMAGV